MNLQYFVGKACTIITGPINRVSFNEKQLQDYFVGLVEAIDARGVWTKHPVTGCKNYYPIDSVIAICEEQVVNDPVVLEKYKEAKKEVGAKTVKTPYINPDMLAGLAQQAKQLNQKPEAS